MSEQKRGRKPIEINADEFQILISSLEAVTPFKNRSELWKAVEDTSWAKERQPRPLTAQVAMMKADELGLEIKTVKGKRGRSKGDKPPVSGRKKKVFSLTVLESGVPLNERAGLQKTLQRAANGSLKARIKLNCLNCCNWDKTEVRECEIKSCPMWDVRPYRKTKTVEETVVNEVFTVTKIVDKESDEFVGLALTSNSEPFAVG